MAALGCLVGLAEGGVNPRELFIYFCHLVIHRFIGYQILILL